MTTTFLKKSGVEGLHQINDLLNQLTPQCFVSNLPILFGSSLGMHVRHILEFYQCFLKGISGGVINYDERERDILLQNDLDFAKSSIMKMIIEIESLTVETDILMIRSSDQNGSSYHVSTSQGRELIYLIEHAIHHMAIIRMSVSQNFPEIYLPDNFGVAYSTKKYKESCAQ